MYYSQSKQRTDDYACQEDVGCSYHHIFYNEFRVHFPPYDPLSSCPPQWEHKTDSIAAVQEHETRKAHTKDTVFRFLREGGISTDEQEINPSNIKRMILSYVMKREIERKRNRKIREIVHPHDIMEKAFIKIFQFKDLNKVPQAAKMPGLLRGNPQSPQQFLSLFKALQISSMKDIQNIIMKNLNIRYSTVIKKVTKEEQIKDILPPPGRRRYPSIKYSNSVLKSTLTPRHYKHEAAWIAKTKALLMSQETPVRTSQSNDELFDNLEVFIPKWESLFRKHFFTGLRHQPQGTQKGSLWPYFPWARSTHWCDFCIPEFRNSNVTSRCNAVPHRETFPWGCGGNLC